MDIGFEPIEVKRRMHAYDWEDIAFGQTACGKQDPQASLEYLHKSAKNNVKQCFHTYAIL